MCLFTCSSSCTQTKSSKRLSHRSNICHTTSRPIPHQRDFEILCLSLIRQPLTSNCKITVYNFYNTRVNLGCILYSLPKRDRSWTASMQNLAFWVIKYVNQWNNGRWMRKALQGFHMSACLFSALHNSLYISVEIEAIILFYCSYSLRCLACFIIHCPRRDFYPFFLLSCDGK